MKSLAAALVFIILSALANVSAQSVVVSPTAYNIDPALSNTAQVRLQNTGDLPVRYRVEVMRWFTENGQYAYAATRDVVANPPEFTLAAHATQVIRVGVLKRAGSDELTYRVFLRQLALPGDAAPSTVSNDVQVNLTTLTNVSLPVYIAPAASVAKVSSQVVVNTAGVPELQLNNTGNRHLTFRQLRVQSGKQTVDLGSVAVLGNSRLTFPLDGLEVTAGSVTLIYNTASGDEQREPVSVLR